MTRVTIKEHPMPAILKGFGRYEVEITGHVVRRDPERNDACVAASILAQTLVQTLRNHKKEFREYHDRVMDDAYVYILVSTNEYTDAFVQAVLEQTKTGFMMLKDNFPEDFQVEWV